MYTKMPHIHESLVLLSCVTAPKPLSYARGGAELNERKADHNARPHDPQISFDLSIYQWCLGGQKLRRQTIGHHVLMHAMLIKRTC